MTIKQIGNEQQQAMTIALLHKYYDAAKLESVKAEMHRLGAPVVKAVWAA